MKRTALVLAALALAATAPQDDKIYSNSYKGKAPPEIKSTAEHWINADEALTLKDLRGRVVWLEFSFLN